MKKLSQYIIEKFKINSKTVKQLIYKDSDLSQETQDKIIDELCQYFQNGYKYEYKGVKYKNGLELIEKKFNNQICSLLDRTSAYKKLSDKIGISVEEFVKYVEDNNDKLYKEIKDFVL